MQISNDITFDHQNQMRLQKAESLSGHDMKKMKDQELRQVSKEFASLFINEVYKSMRKTVEKDGFLDGGQHREVFEDMLYSEYAKMTAQQDESGLGRMVYDFLKRST